MYEDNTNACIVLSGRGEEFTKTITIYEWIPATSISFKKDEYNFLIKSQINLNSLITATSAQANINPNDEYTFSVPASQSSIATVDTDSNGNKVLKLLKAGSVVLVCAGENENVTASCIINIYNPTNDLNVYSNDELISSYSGNLAKNVSVRSGNVLKFKVLESDGANEALKWSSYRDKDDEENILEEYFDVEEEGSTGSVKNYKFTAKDVGEVTTLKLRLSTDRYTDGESSANDIVVEYMVSIYPRVEDGTALNTYVNYGGEKMYETDEFDLYDDEKATVYISPDGIDENEPKDQVNWSIPNNSSFVSKIDYVDISGNNIINATTVTYEEKGDESATLLGKLSSNDSLEAEININTKKTIKSVVAKVGDLKTVTMNVGDTAQIDTVITPADADELLMYESDKPAYATVDADGVISALQKTDSDGVKIYIYSYHIRFGDIIRSASPKAIITVKATVAGSIVVDPDNKTTNYTGSNYKLTATAREEGGGSSTVIDASRAEWSIDNGLVAQLSSNQGGSIFVTPKMVGNAIVTAKFGDAEGDSILAVTAPITDGNVKVSGINTNVSDTPDSDAYIYLPNGGIHDINPVVTATGIDSRQDENEEYILIKNNDYLETNSFTEGKGNKGNKRKT